MIKPFKFKINDNVRYAGQPGVITGIFPYSPRIDDSFEYYYQFSYADNNGIIHQINVGDERALTHA